MRKYDGTLVYSIEDEEGPVEVVDGPGQRSLHFGTYPRQSTMSLFDPLRLELPYTRAMLSSLLFHTTPKRALILGLGGGSLAKFILHHFPGCKLDVVEPRPAVHEVAHQFFYLPTSNKLQVHYTDGANFVAQHCLKHSHYYDWILVDAYNGDGMDLSINRNVFFADCHQLLTVDGILSINLWGSQARIMRDSLDLMHDNFKGCIFKLAVQERANVIGHALGDLLEAGDARSWKKKASELENRFGLIDLKYSARNMQLDRLPKPRSSFFAF